MTLTSILLLILAFLAGWFARMFMERARAPKTAQIDAATNQVGDAANTLADDIRAKLAKRSGS